MVNFINDIAHGGSNNEQRRSSTFPEQNTTSSAGNQATTEANPTYEQRQDTGTQTNLTESASNPTASSSRQRPRLRILNIVSAQQVNTSDSPSTNGSAKSTGSRKRKSPGSPREGSSKRIKSPENTPNSATSKTETPRAKRSRTRSAKAEGKRPVTRSVTRQRSRESIPENWDDSPTQPTPAPAENAHEAFQIPQDEEPIPSLPDASGTQDRPLTPVHQPPSCISATPTGENWRCGHDRDPNRCGQFRPNLPFRCLGCGQAICRDHRRKCRTPGADYVANPHYTGP